MTDFDVDEAIARLVERAQHEQRRQPSALDLGAGGAGLTRHLAAARFRCTAVERHLPDVARRSDEGIVFVKSDLRSYEPDSRSFDLVILRHVLQFFCLAEKGAVFRRALRALRPEGLLLVEAFTTADPSHRNAMMRALPEVETNAFVDPDTGDVFHFFAPGELRAWAEAQGAIVLHYQEGLTDDDHEPYGRHQHGVAFLAATVA